VIHHHPISKDLLDDLYAEWRAFFSSEDKAQYTFTQDTQAGYFPFRSENAKDAKHKDLKEFYHFYPWWKNPDAIMHVTPVFQKAMVDMAATLLNWIEQEAPEDVRLKFSCSLSSMIQDSRETLFRAIHYPPLKGNEKPGEVRAAAHEDINLITLLPTASHPGLQVQDIQGQWHDVPCDPGSMVVNAGDMLQEASGGYFPSTSHRVVNPQGALAREPRYSMPLFLHARPEVRLSDRYTAATYLKERLTALGLIGP